MKHNKNHNNSRSAGPQLEPVHFEFTHPTASAVCIAGTFNDWQPEAKPMQPTRFTTMPDGLAALTATARGMVNHTLERAALALEMGRPEVAEARLVPLLVRRAHWADAHALLGRARLARTDAAGAETALRAALAIHPGFASARADLGWALLRLGRAVEADREFALALELDPLHALPREQMAWREWLTTSRTESGEAR